MTRFQLPTCKLSPKDVSDCITFHSYDSSLNEIQTNGAVALWNLMLEKGFAYLADEVGMGKTWQAMGIIALQFLLKPESKIAVVCPGYDLQDKWQKNWKTFVSTNFRLYDGTIADSWQRQQSVRAKVHHRLREFAEDLVLNEGKLHILRYSSFSKPIWFGDIGSDGNTDAIQEHYYNCIKNIGYTELDKKEQCAFSNFQKDIKELIRELNRCYSFRVGKLADARKIDLLIIDEAQYLRHTKNARNTNLRLVFYKKNISKTLFLSATPLHRGEEDVFALDSYLADKPIGSTFRDENEKVVPTLETFMIRRMRTYSDCYTPKRSFTKHLYRDYSSYGIDARDDAFHCLTLGLVQRKLARILKGKNNEFRMGECSSFESLQQSVKRKKIKDVDGVPVNDPEFENDNSKTGRKKEKDTEEKSPDRVFIDKITNRYRNRLGKYFQNYDERGAQLPHAKIDSIVETLSNNFLKNASHEKAIVFVRRLDTVEELMKRLNSMHQQYLDKRIFSWLKLIGPSSEIATAKEYWKDKKKDTTEELFSENDEKTGSVDEDQTVQHLPFIAALKRTPKGSGKRNGKLVWFQSLLLSKSDTKRKNPLDCFLEPGFNQQWLRFCESIGFSESELKIILKKAERGRPSDFPPILELLKRCILQSLRRSEFIVDLDILRQFGKNKNLIENVIACFNGSLSFRSGVTIKSVEPLWEYINNWTRRLRNWFLHLPLIVDNCFSDATSDNWEDSVDTIFFHVGPVAGRSGRLKTEQTVPQFKLPIHPNILICTDVLREGIDLHLFCDQVYHYGIAWSSGDLEQRIGRVDRYSSLISRKISVYNAQDISDLPKIEVGFPYLKGTLDSLQVERVRRKKLTTDLTLDFGEHGTDDGKMCADELYDVLKEKALNGKEGVFKPQALNNVDKILDDTSLQHLREPDPSVDNLGTVIKNMMVKTLKGSWNRNVFRCENYEYNLKYLSEYNLFILGESQFVENSPDSALCRWRYKKYSGKYTHVKERELLISKEIEGHLELYIGRFVSGTDESIGCGISRNIIPPGFVYCPELNTAKTSIILDNPVIPTKPREQTVFLEKSKYAYFLKTFVAKSSGSHVDRFAEKAGLPRIKGVDAAVVMLNEQQSPGWFSIENGNIMHVWKFPCLEMITEANIRHVAVRADRMQLLMTATDDEIENYRCTFSLESYCNYFDSEKIRSWVNSVTQLTKRSS